MDTNKQVYLPMCYLYSTKYVYADAEEDPLIAALRVELYPGTVYSGKKRRKNAWIYAHIDAILSRYAYMHT